MHSLIVPEGVSALRLDTFLARHLPACSRRTAQRAVAAGAVHVDGRRARKGHTVTAGQTVEVPDDLYTRPALQPNPALAVAVLYEDEALIAIDKPAGMPSLALRSDETGTAANFLLARHPEVGGAGKNDKEGGLAHRLDTDTSGVLLAARTRAAYLSLRRQFAAHEVEKEYAALVHGDVAAAAAVRMPIAHDRHNRRKMRACTTDRPMAGARPALTRYWPVERFGTHTLLRVAIHTGVMHQIRVHLAAIGHPIVGDRLYAPTVCAADPTRQLLHARCVTITHPVTRRPLRITSTVPADFQEFLERLRRARRPLHVGARTGGRR
jgi:23S rRNA pseudouridine1911/1915/1917 synthase